MTNKGCTRQTNNIVMVGRSPPGNATGDGLEENARTGTSKASGKSKLKTIVASTARRIYQRHLITLAWIVYVSGTIAGPCMLPWFASPGGADEKALQLGVSRPQLGTMKTADVMRLFGVERSRLEKQRDVHVLHEARMMWEHCQGEWKHEGDRRHSLRWYSYSGSANVPPHAYDVVEATRSDGTESIMVVFPVRYDSATEVASMTMSLGHGLGWYLQEQEWLAKNVVILYIDVSNLTIHAGLDAWMDGVVDGHLDRRIGHVQQAVILDVTSRSKDVSSSAGRNTVTIKIHGWNGQLPNLDMYMTARKNAEMHASRGADIVVHDAIASSPLTLKLRAFLTFVIHHAIGIADGGHAEMLERGIDAMTLEVAMIHDSNGVKMALQLAEGVVRTLNNLQEKLHHATGLYALSGPYGLIDIGMYMVCPALVLLAHVLKTVKLASSVQQGSVISWDRVVGMPILFIACLAYLFVHIQTMVFSRLVDNRVTLSSAITCLYALCQISMFGMISWKFCAAFMACFLDAKTTKAIDMRASETLATKAILGALVSSVSTCLLLYRWSLGWLVLILMFPSVDMLF